MGTFSGEAILPFLLLTKLKLDFIWSLHWAGEKNPSNDHGYMTKKAAMPIYGKFFFYRNSGQISRLQCNLVCSIRDLGSIVVYSNFG